MLFVLKTIAAPKKSILIELTETCSFNRRRYSLFIFRILFVCLLAGSSVQAKLYLSFEPNEIHYLELLLIGQ